jgi:hypothetical protein
LDKKRVKKIKEIIKKNVAKLMIKRRLGEDEDAIHKHMSYKRGKYGSPSILYRCAVKLFVMKGIIAICSNSYLLKSK